METVNKILVIDDEASIRESLEMFLREKGLAVTTAETGSEGLRACLSDSPQVVILDIRLPDVSGLEVLKGIVESRPDTKVIMITAYHDMETTIEAMRNGAYDYIHKPLDVDELDRAVTKGLHISKASLSCLSLAGSEQQDLLRKRIVGSTPPMRSIFKSIGLLSCNRASVLVEGETGTGKELIARVIHESSHWKDQPFVTVDCTTLVESLLESELFGHKKGAFTGAIESKKGRLELADSGTLFFDEVGELPHSLQGKFLRFLEYREFTRVGGSQYHRCDARIIAATNRNLETMVQEGDFRQDLFFRLKVFTITVPPLRDRAADLLELVKFFMAKLNQELGTGVSSIEAGALDILEGHSWPGNVRELRNVLAKGMLESRGAVLLTEAVAEVLSSTVASPGEARGLCTLDEVEKDHIVMALSEYGGNLSAAARALAISRPTLRKRLKRYGLRA
jgi:two-component system, NtrC family, response regulator AtoC